VFKSHAVTAKRHVALGPTGFSAQSWPSFF